MTPFEPSTSPLPGPNIILQGPGGTGKTHAIGTLVDAGIEVFYLGIEQGMESLIGYWTDGPSPRPVPANLHWHKLEQPKYSYQDFAAQAKRLNTLSLETIAKAPDPSRYLHDQWEKIGLAMYAFKDQRTGEVFEPVDTWHPGRAIVIDGLTGLCRAAMHCVVGSRPVWAPGDYQVGQKQVEGFLRITCDNTKCWFVLIAHEEKEIDPVAGGAIRTVSAIGKALAPIIPPMFSDVILCEREGNKWTWNTARTGAALKARNLPWADGLPADFKPMYESWKRRSLAAG